MTFMQLLSHCSRPMAGREMHHWTDLRWMFFFTYLRRELCHRMRQSIVIALGLALGVGLVVTVAAASAGFENAESAVLDGLYGLGTDVTVTGAVQGPTVTGPPASGNIPAGVEVLQQGQTYWQACNSTGCRDVDGTTLDDMNTPYNLISASKVSGAARLNGVAAAAGGLSLLDQWTTLPKSGLGSPQSGSYMMDGVDTGHLSLGPLSGAAIIAGHGFTAAEADSDVAILDSGYAKARGLKVGSAITIHQARYTVIGIVSQPQEGGNPIDIYLPLARAQAIALAPGEGSLADEVNTIYLTAASPADIPAVSKELSTLLPGTAVTTASSLASQVTASVASAEKLINDLGRWLAVLVLIAAFGVASLLTMAAVTRRTAEFGTLKALGWRSRRIVAQVLGESVTTGVAGAAAGVGLGFAGAAVIAAFAPKASAVVGSGIPKVKVPAGSAQPVLTGGANLTHPVSVPVYPSISADLIVLAVVLAIAGALLAGAFASWRIARLQPADALARVA
jgi:putative ABC transport system permease protein